MKIRDFILVLVITALLPTYTFASESMDPIGASFDRILKSEPSVRYVPAVDTDADPLEAINVALRKGPDPVLVSFVRDLYREPVAYKIMPADGQADPLDVINVALRCGNTDIVNAGISLVQNHC